MAKANFTESEKHSQPVEPLGCSTYFADGLFIYFTTFNIFLSITAFVGNTLILVALQKDSSLHPPSKLLLRCLATTDLCVGLFTEPLYVTYLLSLVSEERDPLCRYALISSNIVGYSLSAVSLLTVTAISMDRLLALLLGLSYRQVVTSKRTRVTVVIFWVISSAAAASYLITPLITFWCGSIGVLLCAATSFVSYTKIFLVLRQHQTRVQDRQQPSQAISLNIARYKKAVSSALWVQLALFACYLPYGIVRATIDNGKLSPSSFLAWELAKTLVYLNSSLNPFLYYWKVGGVKQAIKETIRQAVCCLSS
ncbi:melanocyte-stimulating hormone receptor-like [Orbicella faveolata]|uniref:melanocyte-stimulating hormone receptor-like n=1 Tax=Orbicella faveolata TaxID=48498 RepID=UPI0009E62933|nr:melanocyte-stimulating hormone receptor-like [Orbicella faveolata]